MQDNNLKTSLWYWLGRKKPFIINQEYKLELLFIDKENNSAKIKITNLKNNTEQILNCDQGGSDVNE